MGARGGETAYSAYTNDEPMPLYAFDRRAVDRLKQRVRIAEREYDQLEGGVDHRFHRFWGSLFKTGPEVSSFGHQVEAYACLYTARVSNFLYYSPLHYFQSPRDRMPHELR